MALNTIQNEDLVREQMLASIRADEAKKEAFREASAWIIWASIVLVGLQVFKAFRESELAKAEMKYFKESSIYYNSPRAPQ